MSPSVPGVDTLYVADTSAGLCKFSLVGTNWVPRGAIQRLGKGISALTGQVTGTTVNIFAITTVTGDDEFVSVIDTSGYNGGLPSQFLTTNYSVNDNYKLRGVTFVPQAVTPAIDPNPSLATGSGNDEIVLRRIGDNVVITVGGTTVLDQPLVDTQSLTIDGQAGNDRLTVDYSGGDPLPAGGLTLPRRPASGHPWRPSLDRRHGTQIATYLPQRHGQSGPRQRRHRHGRWQGDSIHGPRTAWT